MAIVKAEGGKLFPKYLNQGSKGPAVNVLGLLMIVSGWDKEHKIVLNGNYAPTGAIAAAVRNFQDDWGVDETDGDFGPETRAAFKHDTGFDVDTLMADMFAGEGQYVGPDDPDEPRLPLEKAGGEDHSAEESHD